MRSIVRSIIQLDIKKRKKRGRTKDNNRFRYRRAIRNIRYRNRKLYIK
jgi:hypothetical protein